MQTQYEFTLPRGYLDPNGVLHKQGRMRLATVMDEIAPLSDARVQHNEAYLALILLSGVITQLGSYTQVTPRMLEDFFAADIIFLQDFYSLINGLDAPSVFTVACPNCNHTFRVEMPGGDQ